MIVVRRQHKHCYNIIISAVLFVEKKNKAHKSLKLPYKSVEMAIITHAFALGRDVIIDRLCLMEKTRRRYIEIARGFDVPVMGIIFPRLAPEIHAERRFKGENRGHDLDYWIKVAKHHDGLYKLPRKEEGFDSLKDYDFEWGVW